VATALTGEERASHIAVVGGERLDLGAIQRVRGGAREVPARDIPHGSRSLPVLREWTTDDLQMIAGLLVNAMIATVEAILDVPVAAPEAAAEISRVAEKQLRLVTLAVPHWRSRG
jgi:alpha-D-ribose 1-methylphosphonate 5-phosphate C-P lyase